MDVTVTNEGTIFTFMPHTAEALVWIEENVHEPLFFGRALVVEHSFAAGVAQGMINDGLVVV